MALRAFRKVKSSDRVVNQIQDNVDRSLSDILKVNILDGRLIKNIELVSSTTKTVNHGLGRDLQGWYLVGLNTNATVWDSQDTNNLPDKTLILNTSANCTVSIWVF